MDIIGRMAYYNVSGLSIAVINGGELLLAKGYGSLSSEAGSRSVDAHTLFQAGSISKTLTAVGALILVQQGELSLDQDVNLYLKSWKVPENKFTKLNKVTLRRLLSHSAGISVYGFPGYSIDQKIPSLIDILNGTKPLVNTDPICVISEPGSGYLYSGGGTTIVQQLIEDVTNKKFDVWMQNNVLNPLGMLESSFTQALHKDARNNRASGHNKIAVKGNWHIYPEMAAAGLWTNSSDLAKFIISMQNILHEMPGILSYALAKEMITSQRDDLGLGVFMKGEGVNFSFYHEGWDEGFIAVFYAYPFLRKGVAIMINKDGCEGGEDFMNEVKLSIADTYNFP